MRCIFTNRTVGITSFFYWYQSYHWYKWAIGLTNRIRLGVLEMCEIILKLRSRFYLRVEYRGDVSRGGTSAGEAFPKKMPIRAEIRFRARLLWCHDIDSEILQSLCKWNSFLNYERTRWSQNMWVSRVTLWQLYNKDPEIKIMFLTVILLKVKLMAFSEPMKKWLLA